jgi:hypothetical protein
MSAPPDIARIQAAVDADKPIPAGRCRQLLELAVGRHKPPRPGAPASHATFAMSFRIACAGCGRWAANLQIGLSN